MKMDKFLLALVIVAHIFFASVIGYELGKRSMRQEALLNGHAVYIYSSDGMPNFKWNECIQF
jgi:hypothetical protein